MTNFQEYLAGTDPLNANLVLKITRIEAMGGGVSLTWNSEPGRIYAVEMALSLNRPFLAVAANLEATPPRNVHIVPVDPVSVRGAFFRVIEQAVRDEESEP